MDTETEARFTGHLDLSERIFLGHHDIVRAGRGWASDAFAEAYGLQIVDANGSAIGPRQALWFRDDAPACDNLIRRGRDIFYLADNATFRFMTREGKRGGGALTISHDGGQTFSENRYPGSLVVGQELNEPSEHADAIQKFGYHRDRMTVTNMRIELELTDPLTYRRFLQFISDDQGLHWTNIGESSEPRSYPRAEVEKWREQFAVGRWIEMFSEATRAACARRPGVGCASEVDRRWNEVWRTCRATRSAQACLSDFVAPAID